MLFSNIILVSVDFVVNKYFNLFNYLIINNIIIIATMTAVYFSKNKNNKNSVKT